MSSLLNGVNYIGTIVVPPPPPHLKKAKKYASPTLSFGKFSSAATVCFVACPWFTKWTNQRKQFSLSPHRYEQFHEKNLNLDR